MDFSKITFFTTIIFGKILPRSNPSIIFGRKLRFRRELGHWKERAKSFKTVIFPSKSEFSTKSYGRITFCKNLKKRDGKIQDF